MGSVGFAAHVYIWAIKFAELNPRHNVNAMNQFLQILRDVNGKEFRPVGAYATDIDDVIYMLRQIMPSLIESLEREMPELRIRLVGIDWRVLFGIEPYCNVTVEVTKPPSDDSDSGEGSLSANSASVMDALSKDVV